MPVGLVGIAPNESGADNLLSGLDTLQRWVYDIPLRLIEDLRAKDPKRNLKASRVLGEEYVRLFAGKPFFMIYFVGCKEAEVYEIPSSVVLASGHNPEAFTHDVLLYLAGRPAVAISRENGKDGHLEMTAAENLARVHQQLKNKYGKTLGALKIPITGYKSGIVLPINGIRQPTQIKDLETIAQSSH